MNSKSAVAKIWCGLFLLVFICGCATITAKRDVSAGTRVFLDSYEDVWNNLLDVISKKEIPLRLKTKQKGIILFIIGTEEGILHRLRKDNSEKTFHLLSRKMTCPNMKRTRLSVLRAMEKMEYVIKVPEDTGPREAGADRMLEVR